LLVAGNTMFDMKNDIGGALFGCSAMIVEPGRSATGRPLFGRNLDYPTLGYVQEYSLVTVYRQPGKHAFAAVGFPGLVGVLSGMNDAGLSLAVLEVYAPKEKPAFDPEGLPYAVCYRRLLEECTTVDEAEKLLKSLKRATTSNLAVCDRNGGAVFEVTPTKVVRRPADHGVCNCTNHFCTTELAPSTPFGIGRTRERFAELEKAGRQEKLGVEELHKALHAASHRTHTMQTMVFDPAALTLHLAIGKTPSSGLELRRLELGELLKDKPTSR
jgi:isopenicillin-N N-acyltransferase like protein